MAEGMALVCLYEVLIGKGLQCGGALRKTMHRHEARLRAELARLLVRAKVSDVRLLLPPELRPVAAAPVFARVNRLKSTPEAACRDLAAGGFTLVPAPSSLSGEGSGLAPREFAVDIHLSDVLVFAAGTDFHDNPLYLDGRLILQDKASCFPATALAPPPGAIAMDGCCAPGNKTSHMAACMQNSGTLYAFDLDARRLQGAYLSLALVFI
jgi:putative methyltransferase